MKQVVRVVACLALASAGLSAQGQGQPPQTPAPQQEGQSRIIQRILVKVNGEAFTQTDLEREQVSAIKRSRPDATSRTLTKEMLDEVTPDILVGAVDEMLELQHGRELGFRMTDEKFKTFVESFKKEYKLDDAQLKAALAEEGMTMEAWREQWERTSIIREVEREEIGQNMQLTEAERRQYYAAHPDQFMTPASVTLREIHILVPTQMQNGRPAFSAQISEDAQAKLVAIRERIVKGEDFIKVAGEVSESQTKVNGGLLGEFKLDDIDGALREKIEKLQIGDMTEPFRTGRGWQVLRLDAKSAPQLKAFDTVQDEIFQKMYEARLDGERHKLLTRIRAQALIEWYDDGLKKIYEKRLAERANATAK